MKIESVLLHKLRLFCVHDGGANDPIATFRSEADAELFVRAKERRAKVMLVLKDISPSARAEVEKAFDDFCRPAPISDLIESKPVEDITHEQTLAVIRRRNEELRLAGKEIYEKIMAAGVQPDVVIGADVGDGTKPATFRRTPIQYVDKLPGDDIVPVLSKNWSAIGGSFVWNDRMVKVEDGLLCQGTAR